MSSRRLAGFAGLGFAALVGSVNIILGSAGMPQVGASPADVREFFTEQQGTVALVSAMATLVWLLLPVFGAGLVARFRREPVDRVESWPLLALGGVFMQNTLFAGVVGTQVALSSGGLSDDAGWAVWQLHNALFTLNGTSLALILCGFSIAGLRTGVMRAWHARVGFTAAAVLAVSSFTTPWHTDVPVLGLAGFGGFLLWLVWVVASSLVLLRERRPVVDDAPAAVAVTA